MILPVIWVDESTEDLVKANLDVAASFGIIQSTAAIATTSDAVYSRIEQHQKAFKFVWRLPIEKWGGQPFFPAPQNHAWQQVTRVVGRDGFNSWFWWLPDACPLRANWLEELNTAYKNSKKLFGGAKMPSGYMNGVGIYPVDCITPLADCSALFTYQQPYDVAAGSAVMKSFKDLSDMIVIHPQLYYKTGVGLSGYRTFTKGAADALLQSHPKAVFYRGCVDGSLHRALLGKDDIQIKLDKPVRQSGLAPKYTISMLCMNNADLTEICLESVLAHSGEDYEIIITDNASSDSTPEMLTRYKDRFKGRLQVIRNHENKGFQEPNEFALTIAQGEYFVLLNNDLEVCENWLEKLCEPFSNPKMAITGFRDTCVWINDQFRGVPGSTVEYIEGSCLMVPTALVRKHGLFSPYLQFIYFEDTDLSLRLRELGYEIQTVDMPISHHHRNATTKHLDLAKYVEHNKSEMWKRWGFYIKRRNFKRKVLLKRRGARGDVLLLSPVIKALKAKWPQADITVQTAHPEMITDPEVTTDSVETAFDHEYDLDLSYEKRPDVHIVQAYADACEVELPKDWNVEIHCSKEDDAWGLRRARGFKVALIHGGYTTWPGKNWPIDRMEKVVSWLKERGFFTIAVGGKDAPLCGCDDSVTNEATIQQLCSLAKHAKLFVGLDSMPQHVVSAANTPSVVLFGATNPKCIVRDVPWIIPVQADRSKADCIGAHGRRTNPVVNSICEGDCMKAISVDDVTYAITRVLEVRK